MAYEMKVLSAHRLPDMTADYARSAEERGLEVIICGAGMAAYLACQVRALRDKSLVRRLEDARWKNHNKILRATIPSHIMVPAGAVIRSQEDARFFRTTHVKEQNYQKDVLVACHNIRQAYKALDVTQEQ